MEQSSQHSPNSLPRRKLKRTKNEEDHGEQEEEKEDEQSQQLLSSPTKRRIIRRKNASTGSNTAAIDLEAKLEENNSTSTSTTNNDTAVSTTNLQSGISSNEKPLQPISNENDKITVPSASTQVPTNSSNTSVPSTTAPPLNTKEASLPLKLRFRQFKTSEPPVNNVPTAPQPISVSAPASNPSTVAAIEPKQSPPPSKLKPEVVEEGQNSNSNNSEQEEEEEEEEEESKIEFFGSDTKPVIRKRDGKNKARSFSYATNIKPSTSFRKKFPSIFFENTTHQKAMITITESKKNIFGEKNLHCIYRGVEYIEKGCSLYCASCRQCAPIKFVCENIMNSQNSCKKVICLKCVKSYGGKDLDTLVQNGGWLCFNCRDLPNPAKKGAAALLALNAGNNDAKIGVEQSDNATSTVANNHLNRAGKPMRSAASKTANAMRRNQSNSNKNRRRSKVEEEEDEDEEEEEDEEGQEEDEKIKEENDEVMEEAEEVVAIPDKVSTRLLDWSKNLIMDLIKL